MLHVVASAGCVTHPHAKRDGIAMCTNGETLRNIPKMIAVIGAPYALFDRF